MRARWYDPAAGRFISEDPKKDEFNWYVYCDNNPVNRVDQDGNTDFDPTVFMAAFWALTCVPMANPFLQMAMYDFLGLHASNKWIEEAGTSFSKDMSAFRESMIPMHDLVEDIPVVSCLAGALDKLLGAVAVDEMMEDIGLAGVDMAMEEGR